LNERKVDRECHRPRDLAAGEFYGDVVRRHTSPQFVLSELHHARGRVLPTHAHQTAYFSLLIEGRYTETYDGRHHEYDPLTVWWHRPGVVHDDAVGHSGGRFFNVELTRDGTDLLAEAGPTRRDFHEHGTRVVWLACRLLRELRNWQPCSTPVAEALALEMAGSALRHPERPAPPPPAWLRRVVQRLHDEPDRHHYTSTLAREAGVHPVHLAAAAPICHSPKPPTRSASPTRPISPASSVTSSASRPTRSAACYDHLGSGASERQGAAGCPSCCDRGAARCRPLDPLVRPRSSW